jgi:hypothetical protein
MKLGWGKTNPERKKSLGRIKNRRVKNITVPLKETV